MKLYKYVLVIGLCLGLGACELNESDHGMDSAVDDTGDIGLAGMDKLVVDLPVAHVEVQEYQSVHLVPQPSYDVDLRVSYADGIEHRRTLRLGRSVDAQREGITFALLDEGDTQIIGITQRWGMDSDSTYRYFLHEVTSSDELTRNATVHGSDVSESYDYNGHTAELVYTRDTPEEDRAVAAFSEFYHGPQVSATQSLSYNEEGLMMMGLVSDTAFVSWAQRSIRPAHEAGSLAKPNCDWGCHACGIAGACSLVKCPFGAMGNPVCVICGGVGMGCAVAYVFKSIF